MFCSLVAETLRLHTLDFAWIGFSLMGRDFLAFVEAVVLSACRGLHVRAFSSLNPDSSVLHRDLLTFTL